MHRASALALGAAAIIVLAACGAGPAGSPAAGSAGTGPSAAAGASAPESVVPTDASSASPSASASSAAASAGTGTATGSDCTAMASPDANGQTPMSEYPDLLAMIPEELGGQRTHGRDTFRIVEFLCQAGGQAVVDGVMAAAPDGFDLAALQYAGASVNLGEPTSGVAALRVPGADADFMVERIGSILPLIGGSTEQVEGTSSEDTLGGKSVIVFSPPESRSAYLYPSGEVLFVITPKDADVAETILAALP